MPIELTILGSGSATPTLSRNPSGQLLRIHDQDLLIDCGEGTQMQLLRFQHRINRIKAVFISHLHGDHYLGLPGLISSMHLTGRVSPLTVYGPAVLEQIMRLQFSVSQTVLRFPLEFIPTHPEKPAPVADFAGFTVSSFPLHHRIPCTGFLFREKPHLHNLREDALKAYAIPYHELKAIKQGADYITPEGLVIPNRQLTHEPKPPVSYAYCSDTSPDPQVTAAIQGVDWLYHEATFSDELVSRARDTFHSTAREAGQTAKDAGARHLLIGHFSSRYKDLQPLIDEARGIFPGTEAVYDGMTVRLD